MCVGGQRDLESVLDSDCDLVYDPLQSGVLSSSTPKAFLSLLFFPCFFVRMKCEIITCEFFSLLGLNPKPNDDCLTRLGKPFCPRVPSFLKFWLY